MNFISAIDRFTGYGITSYNIFEQLYDMDKDLVLHLIANPNLEDSWNVKKIFNAVQNRSKFNKDQPCFKLWQQNELFLRTVGNSKYGALSFFELDTVLPVERACYESLDLIFTPSSWGKEVLENNNIKTPIIVCPQGVDMRIFYPEEKPADKPEETYTFINIGKWEIRKGHDMLIEIFNKAFEKTDSVELWMVNNNPFLTQEQHTEWQAFYKDTKLGDKIRFFPRLETQKILSHVIKYADCGIFPSRAEGWNNEAIEIMAMDKPLIITNYSAHKQYCNKDNSYLIDITEKESADDGVWFKGDGNWASLNTEAIDQAVEHMRYVHKNKIRSNPQGLITAKEHTWEKAAKTIYDNMVK